MSKEIVDRLLTSRPKLIFENSEVAVNDLEDSIEEEIFEEEDLELEEPSLEEELDIPEDEEEEEISEGDSLRCVCGSTNIVKEDGKDICDDCGREINPVTELSEPKLPRVKSKSMKESFYINIDSGKLERAMKSKGYRDSEYLEFIYDVYGLEDGEDFQVGNDHLELGFYKSSPKIQKLKRELGESKSVTNSSERMKESMTNNNDCLRRVLTLWNMGRYSKAMDLCKKCGISNREFAEALVKTFNESQEAELEVIKPEDSRSTLDKNIIRALQEPVTTADKPSIDSAIKEAVIGITKGNSRRNGDYTYTKFTIPNTRVQFSHTVYENGVEEINSIHPYDDADYHWAVKKPSDTTWLVYIHNPGKLIEKISTKDIEKVAKRMADLDAGTKSKMVHN